MCAEFEDPTEGLVTCECARLAFRHKTMYNVRFEHDIDTTF